MSTNSRWEKRPFLAWVCLVAGWPLFGATVAWLALQGGASTRNWVVFVTFIMTVTGSILITYLLLERLPQDYYADRSIVILIYIVAAGTIGLLLGLFAQRPLNEMTSFDPELDLRVEAAAQVETPGYKRFENGRILPDFEGEYTVTDIDSDGVTRTDVYRVVPIVPDVWRSQMPIVLWAVAGSQETGVIDFAAWEAPFQGLVVTRHLGDYGRAIENAAETHGLEVAEQTLLLRLHRLDAEQLAQRFQRIIWLFLGITAVCGWLPLVLAIRDE